MKVSSLCLAFAGLSLVCAADPVLSQIRQVYILPMGGGLDQYLANRLTRNGRYAVVTDPQQADAVLTDQIGLAFEDRMKELYPPPEPPARPSDDKAKAKDKDKEEDKSLASLMGQAGGAPARTSTFSRGKGNVFLVDRNSKRVLWSTFLRARNTRPEEMNHTADSIVDQLDTDTKKQVKEMVREQQSTAAPVAPAKPAAVAPAAPAPAPPKPVPPAK